MPPPVKPVAPPQALRSNPDTFSPNAELAIQYQWTALPNWIEAMAEYTEDQADAATAAALTGDVAPDIARAFNFLRLNAAGAALEYRTLAEIVADIGGLAGSRFDFEPIGKPFALWDHITGCPIPSNAGTAKFIRLTAGLTGSGGYNEGLLGSESVTGSAPLVQATAEILVGPMAGETVYLVNTMEAFLRARATSGLFQQDQMQRITGETNRATGDNAFGSATGALTGATAGGAAARAPSAGGASTRITLDSANSPNARVSSGTDGETRSKNVSATMYLRIA